MLVWSSDFSPRLTQTHFRHVRDNLTDIQLEASSLSVGPESTQEAVRLLLHFFRLDSLRRNHGETVRHWTRRFTLQYSKVGQALNASNCEISKDILNKNIRCILLAETSGLTSSEFASVLATRGTTSAEGESIGKRIQWGDAALAAGRAKAKKS